MQFEDHVTGKTHVKAEKTLKKLAKKYISLLATHATDKINSTLVAKALPHSPGWFASRVFQMSGMPLRDRMVYLGERIVP